MYLPAETTDANAPPKDADLGKDSPQPIQTEVKALLDSLTDDRFDLVSDRLVEIANGSVGERDSRTTRLITVLVVEKATGEGTKPETSPVQGGALVRKYLLNRCQEEYETSFSARQSPVQPLVLFMAELYRVQMLTERIVHEAIRDHLGMHDFRDEVVETACILLMTVGKDLDKPQTKQHMDVYFVRLYKIAQSPKISSKTRLMILGLFYLRGCTWDMP
ncbi:hypothetical protein JCM10212_005845 [Sporobolomyces blumeae]